jgi:hypothetical protein
MAVLSPKAPAPTMIIGDSLLWSGGDILEKRDRNTDSTFKDEVKVHHYQILLQDSTARGFFEGQ